MSILAKTDLHTVQQTASIVQLQPEAVRDWIKREIIAAVRLPGGQYRIPRSEIDRLLRGSAGGQS